MGTRFIYLISFFHINAGRKNKAKKEKEKEAWFNTKY